MNIPQTLDALFDLPRIVLMRTSLVRSIPLILLALTCLSASPVKAMPQSGDTDGIGAMSQPGGTGATGRKSWMAVANGIEAIGVPAGSSIPSAVPTATARYILQLADAPLAAYAGRLPGYPATSPAARALAGGAFTLDPLSGMALSTRPAGRLAMAKLDLTAPSVRLYGEFLTRRQDDFMLALRRVAPAAVAQYHYRVATNGVAVRLTPDQAVAAEHLPGVVGVTGEAPVRGLMDTSLGQINAPAAWADLRIGGRARAGKGVRLALIDSGITAAHPFFTDTGFAAPIGFPTATLTVGDRVYGYSTEQLAQYTNNKVIVARAYANPETVTSTTPTQQLNPLADGLGGFHGAHTAGTAAGAVVQGGPGTTGRGSLTLSGVAPGAYLMAYKFTNAYTPELLRMIDDAVADGADVINNSWGTSAMNVLEPEHHPVAQAFAAATRAGVVVVAAAGNSGQNGEATLGGPHQMSASVITVANVETGRTFAYRLIATDDGLPIDLREHPTVIWELGAEFDVAEGPAYHGDLCNVLASLKAHNKVVLMPLDKVCDTTLIQLPIQIPGFEFVPSLIQQLVTAQAAGAKAAVAYLPTGQPLDLSILGQVLKFLPQTQNLQFPPTAMIAGSQAISLTEWADTHTTLKLKLDHSPTRSIDPARVDLVAPSSSQGPVPAPAAAGAEGPGHIPAGDAVPGSTLPPLKPDLSAPGTDILSTNTGVDGSPNGYTTASGTSMASPHVAGAAAVLRQAWPAWTPADIRAALLTTADPVAKVNTSPIVSEVVAAAAPATVQGAGRLDLGRAVDPGALVTPPTLNLGNWGLGSTGVATATITVRDVRLGAEGAAVYRLRHEPGPLNTLLTPDLPAEIQVPQGGQQRFTVTFTHDAPLPAGDYDGRIVLASERHSLRVTYFVRVLGAPKQVLLLNVRRSLLPATGGGGGIIPGLPGAGQPFADTPDYGPLWTRALDGAGLSYDVWTVAEGEKTAAPPLAVLQRYRLVILAAGDGNAPLDALDDGMTSLQMYLLGGGRMLISGSKWPHSAVGANVQTNGAMYFLSRYFAGFELRQDDAPISDTLKAVRIFSAPIALATAAEPDAAGNGRTVDLGRPLAALTTRGQGALDTGLAAPLVVSRIQPYMHSYVEVEGRGSAMTGVTPDATLEHPLAGGAEIPWRALFAGFGVEAVRPGAGRLSRADLLAQAYGWAVESDDVAVTVTAPDRVNLRTTITLRAAASSPSGVPVVAWRWDLGDGRPYQTALGAESAITVSYVRRGRYVVRAEATTRTGHTYVAEGLLRVGPIAQIELPMLMRGYSGQR